MENENTDTKFVRSLFGFIAWMMISVPFIYSIAAHEWLMMVCVMSAAIGATLKTAISRLP